MYFIIFSVVILFLLLQYLGRVYYQLFSEILILKYTLWIGVFLHEFGHYIMCKLTGAPVYEFKVQLDQGHVTHGKSKIPIIGGLMISLAPFFIGIAALIWLFLWITRLGFKEFLGMMGTGSKCWIGICDFKGFLMVASERIDFISWQFILYVLLTLIVLAVFNPSTQDLKNVTYGLILYVIVSLLWEPLLTFNLLLLYILIWAVGILGLATLILYLYLQIRRRFLKRQ